MGTNYYYPRCPICCNDFVKEYPGQKYCCVDCEDIARKREADLIKRKGKPVNNDLIITAVKARS